MRKIDLIIVHCSASTFGNVEVIRHWHSDPKPKGRGWSDIGYHYVINNGKAGKYDEYEEYSKDGFIEEGRPLFKAGAHCKGHNTNSIGICMIGDGEYTEKQYVALGNLLRGLLVQFDLEADDIKPHSEYANKSCPKFDLEQFKLDYNLI